MSGITISWTAILGGIIGGWIGYRKNKTTKSGVWGAIIGAIALPFAIYLVSLLVSPAVQITTVPKSNG